MARKGNVGAFLVGFAAGAIVGLLLAPKPGTETRADLADYGEAVRERAEEVAARVSERVGPSVESIRDAVGPVIEQMAGSGHEDRRL